MEKSLSVSEHLSRLLPRMSVIDPAWMENMLPAELLNRRHWGPQVSRLLMRGLGEIYAPPVPDKMELAPHERWLLLTTTRQRQLASRLGGLACAEFIRTVVKKEQVEKVLNVVGEDQYDSLLKGASLPVNPLSRQDFNTALIDDTFEWYLIGVGVALLEFTLDRDERFFSMRMRFSFPPLCWTMRPEGISTDINQLNALVVSLSNTLQETSEELKDEY